MVVQGGHLKDSAFMNAEGIHLKQDGKGLGHKDAADNDEKQLLLDA